MPSQVPATKEFGSVLSDLMRERKISAEHLSRETKISVRLIRKYKSGETIPRDHFGDPTINAVKLAAALGVDIDDLLPAERAAA